MSAKDLLLETIRRMPDSSSLEELVHAITDRLNRAIESEWSADEISDDEWRLFVARGLESELADPRQDIYTLTDGEPLNEPG